MPFDVVNYHSLPTDYCNSTNCVEQNGEDRLPFLPLIEKCKLVTINLYRWLFLKKEQISLPKLISERFKILHFSDNISKIIMVQKNSGQKSMNLKGKLHYGIDSIVKFQGFQIFGCEFGEWFRSCLRKSVLHTFTDTYK